MKITNNLLACIRFRMQTCQEDRTQRHALSLCLRAYAGEQTTRIVTESVSRINVLSSSVQRPRIYDSFGDPCALEGITVLLVEDESDTRDMLTTILHECGARVVAVESAQDALSCIENELPNIILSDIGMRGENGYDLIKQIRSLPPEKGGTIPAVALTAYAGPSDRRRALVAGFHVHLAKPVEPDELLAVIKSLGRTTSGGSHRR